jgi:hypothetical protein
MGPLQSFIAGSSLVCANNYSGLQRGWWRGHAVPGQSVGPAGQAASKPASDAALEAWIARRRNVCDAGVTRSRTKLGKVKCVRFGLDILHAVAPGYVQIAVPFLSVQTIDSAAQVPGALAFKKQVFSNAKSQPLRLSARPLTRHAGNLGTHSLERRPDMQEAADGGLFGVVCVQRKISRRHVQIQRFPGFSDGKATAEGHGPAFSLGLTCSW